MGLDINIKKAKKNAFRISKERGIGPLPRIRVPGGYLKAEILGMVQGNCRKRTETASFISPPAKVSRSKASDWKIWTKINEMLQPIIELLDINQTEKGTGYPASGTRNITACIGNNVCPFANYNTAEFAKRVEKEVFPNDLHFKIAFTALFQRLRKGADA